MSHILIVDDNELNNELLEIEIKNKIKDATLEIATTLRQAEEKIKKPFDLIILDHQLPDGNGLKLLENINEKKVIYYTGTKLPWKGLYYNWEKIVAPVLKSDPDKLMEEILRFISPKECHYKTDLDLLEEMAGVKKKKSMINNSKRSRQFKKLRGITKREYMNQLALKIAKDFLSRGYDIPYISKKLNYTDKKSFERFFNRRTGQTPIQFQQSFN